MSTEKVIHAVFRVFFHCRRLLVWCDANAGMLVLISPVSITTWPVYTVPTLAPFFFVQQAILGHTIPPHTPFLSPSVGAELRFLHVVVESSRRGRGAHGLRSSRRGRHDPNMSAS